MIYLFKIAMDSNQTYKTVQYSHNNNNMVQHVNIIEFLKIKWVKY